MRNLIVLGSGRSGTSLVAGLFARAGYYGGENLIGAQPANPKGYFESFEINRLNEDLLAGVSRQDVPRKLIRWPWSPREKPSLRQFWLSQVPLEAGVAASPECARRLEQAVSSPPFCFKDPRFCYTLPAWRPYLGRAAFLCVFRAPDLTAGSILHNCRTSPYYADLSVSRRWAFDLWECMYTHILEKHQREGDWLFVHYQQAVGGEAFGRLEQFTGARVDPTLADPVLSRSRSAGRTPRRLQKMYKQLCDLAGYEADVEGVKRPRVS